MDDEELEEMRKRHKEWQEATCENCVRMSGCPDEGPYYDVPWCEGPIPTYYTEKHCSACVEEDPRLTIEDGEAVWDASDSEYIELDKIYPSKIDDLMTEEELIAAHEEA